MDRLENLKKQYDQTAIPRELHDRVNQEIERSRQQQENRNSAGRRRWIRNAGAAAAAVCILFTAALNTSQVFAEETSQLPLIGGLARVLTFRSYEAERDDIAIAVEIPSIEMIAEDTGSAADKINQEILDCCTQYAKEAQIRAEEYRLAFLETGGTPEEWAEHDVRITVDYEIKQQSDEYLSFVVRGMESWTGAYAESKYYNLDCHTGELVTLRDLLGDDFVELANENIREQIAERQQAGETFFTEEEGGFAGISENIEFYINEKNHPVIVFEPYEIAPGAAGEVEFEISR